MSELLAKIVFTLKLTKLEFLQANDQVFFRKVLISESVANTLHFLHLYSKIALTSRPKQSKKLATLLTLWAIGKFAFV